MNNPLAGVSCGRYWASVAAFVVALLTVQSFMGRGIDKFKELWGVGALEIVTYTLVAAGAGAVLWIGGRVWARCTAADRVWIAVALLLYGVGTLSARNPQERLHYLGYGMLAALLYVGFARDGERRAAEPGGEVGVLLPALLAFVLGSLIGYADELLQILWPRRYFDWADVGMNIVAVGLGLLVAVPVWRATGRD